MTRDILPVPPEVGRGVPQVPGNKRHEDDSLMVETKWLCQCLVWLLAMLSLNACTKDDAARQAFFGEKISCPGPAVDEFDSWGKSGSEHVCKIKHGLFVAFENGYVQIRGQYEYGKKVGIWRWYDREGKIEKQIDYSDNGDKSSGATSEAPRP